jgi:stage II sporulation protein D
MRAPEPPAPPLPDGWVRVGLRALGTPAQQAVRLPRGGALHLQGAAEVRPLLPGTLVELRAAPSGEGLTLRVSARLPGARRPGPARRPRRAATPPPSAPLELGRSPSLVLEGPLLEARGRHYPQRVLALVEDGGVRLINQLGVEEYLEGVLPGEIPAAFAPAAQRALAVAARTYSQVQQGKHGAYDLCDGPCCQVYLGQAARPRPGAQRVAAAIHATRGEYLWWRGELAYTFYSAHCGGLSTRGEDVHLRDKPERPLPYLTVVRDAPPGGGDYCATSPLRAWSVRAPMGEVEALLNRREPTAVGRLTRLAVVEQDPSGRILRARPTGTGSAPEDQPPGTLLLPAAAGGSVLREVTGWELRRSLGARLLRSLLAEIDEPAPGIYRFRGRGSGHGLGLCQIGANGMARAGKGYREILAHYYPGTHVAPAPPGREAGAGAHGPLPGTSGHPLRE